MSNRRIDDLLEQLLATGEMPGDASPSEHAELEQMQVAAQRLSATRSGVLQEAAASQPIARARFERFLDGAAHPVSAPQRRRFLAQVTRAHRRLVLAGSACAVGVLAVLAVFVFQAAFSTTTDANAEVLNLDDYAQTQGVITQVSSLAGNPQLTVQTTFGAVSVALDSNASISEGTQPMTMAELKAGQQVTFSGVVTGQDMVDAHTVVVSSSGVTAPSIRKSQELKQASAQLEGKVLAFVVAPDGKSARVLLDVNGKSYVVRIGGDAVERLLDRSTNVLGASVQVTQGSAPGLFNLDVSGKPGITESLMGIRGIVVSRSANILVVRTVSAEYQVVVRAQTRIVVGKTTITASEVRDGRAILGHRVSVAGAVDSANGRVTADVIVVGARYVPGSGSGTPRTPAAPAASS